MKDFLTQFWASPFNKAFCIVIVLVAVVIYYGTGQKWFRKGWKQYIPHGSLALAILTLVFKDKIVEAINQV